MLELDNAKTIIEPFKVKMVEPLPMLNTSDRRKAIKEADYNLFKLKANTVSFDLLTDSGTSAMSANQWAGMMIGDESYAGARSFTHFEQAVQDVTGLKHIIPTHQGRSAEFLLMNAILKKGQVVLGNTHFDTTRANIENVGAIALDMPCEETKNSEKEYPFKGNLNTAELKTYLTDSADKVAFLIMTVTNNSVGGQPVSMENIIQTKQILDEYKIPMFLDCARFAENSYFIKLREEKYKNTPVADIAKEMFSYCSGALMSAKKDTFANMGGFLALNDKKLVQQIQTAMVVTEGFPTYGGLSGRDMEALAIGIKEILDENYLAYRLRSVEYFAKGIEAAGYKIIKPIGGHAIYIDAGKTLPHIPANEFPGQSLSVALFEHIGLRSVEIGTVMLGHKDHKTGEEFLAPKELLRLAIPRRVYTQSHVDYMIEKMKLLAPHLGELKGYKFKYQAPVLRHFTAEFEPL